MRMSREEYLPTLQDIRREYGISSRALAEAAGLELRVEYLMEIGGPVSRADAARVLQALSSLTNKHYTEKDIRGLYIID